MYNFYQDISDFEIILASKSPRRVQLITDLGIQFKIVTRDVDETYPPELKREQVALHLALKKANAFEDLLTHKNILVITADTVVCAGNLLIGKPSDASDAFRILQLLSGKMHEVFTAVCISSVEKKELFFARSEVHFKKLTDDEINFYIEHFKPFDKAGAYGVQDWIGLVAIEKIIGSYQNVMGLPVKDVYERLYNFFPVK